MTARNCESLALALVALWAALITGWAAAAWTMTPTRQAMLDALRMVESAGKDDCADGDQGRAIGPFQIWEPYWQDAVAADQALAAKAGGSYQRCRDRSYASAVVAAYMGRYVPDAWRQIDAEVIARTHNGGPKGASRDGTRGYWQRVKKALLTGTR